MCYFIVGHSLYVRSCCSDEDVARIHQMILAPESVIKTVSLNISDRLKDFQKCLLQLRSIIIDNLRWEDADILRSILTDPQV